MICPFTLKIVNLATFAFSLNWIHLERDVTNDITIVNIN